MKDAYPDCAALPADCRVPPELQPEYLDLPGVDVGSSVNLGHELCDAHVAAGHGDDLAVIDAATGHGWSYAELAARSSRLAGVLLRRGLRPGERVAIRMPNRPETVAAALAVWKAGGVVVPTPAQARPAELRFFLDDAQAAVLIVDGKPRCVDGVAAAVDGSTVTSVVVLDPPGPVPAGWLDWQASTSELDELRAAVDTPADQVAVLWHTGGTTGVPKGCYHTHRRFLLAGHALVRGAGVRPGQRWAAATPMGHALGFIHNTTYSLLGRATTVLIEDFSRPAAVLDAIARHRVEVFTAITATWAGLLSALAERDRDTGSLRRGYAMWQSASSSEVSDGWRARGITLLNNFGSTSFATWVLLPRADDPGPRASLGVPAPGYEVRAVVPGRVPLEPVAVGEPGQLAVRGPSGLTYWRQPDLQRRDVVEGWTLQDDLVSLDQDGRATYLGRTDYLISTAGYKVAPVEVEAVLARHPAVREVCVVGAADPVRHEVVAAFVAVHPGVPAGAELRRELQDLAKAELSPYKYPRRVEFVPALPRDHVGKVLPGMVRSWAAGEVPVPVAAAVSR